MKHDKNKQRWLLELLKNNTITLTLLGCSTLITFVNIIFLIKLSPLVQRVTLLEVRADAFQAYRNQGEPLIERFFHLESTVSAIEKRGQRIEDKLDRFIENQ
jgi:hypothetical protein